MLETLCRDVLYTLSVETLHEDSSLEKLSGEGLYVPSNVWCGNSLPSFSVATLCKGLGRRLPAETLQCLQQLFLATLSGGSP